MQLAIDELPDEVRPIGSGLLQVFFCTSPSITDNMECEVALASWEPYSAAHVQRLIQVEGLGISSTEGAPYPSKRVTGWTVVEDCPNWEELGGLQIDVDDAGLDALMRAEIPAPGDKVGGWPLWVQGVEYPSCSICGSTTRYVAQIESSWNLPIQFGDHGNSQLFQCPVHAEILALTWAST